MSTMLRNVGATETNPKLQDSFFKCSEAYAELDQLLLNYSECEAQQKLLLGEAKKLLVTPLRVSVKYTTPSEQKRADVDFFYKFRKQ